MTARTEDKWDYFGIDVPFMRHIGLEPVSMKLDSCLTRLLLNAACVNSRGVIHGGALMSALDFTLSAAARSHAPLDFSVVTIDMTTHFLNEGKSELQIEGRCVRRGKSITFCEGDVRDQEGRLVTTATGVFKLLDIDRIKRAG